MVINCKDCDREKCGSYNVDRKLDEGCDMFLVKSKNVDHPQHYNGIPGVECIDVVRHMNFNVGNAVKYLWRAGLKSEEGMTDKQKQIEDLKKAIWYINDEIKRIEQ